MSFHSDLMALANLVGKLNTAEERRAPLLNRARRTARQRRRIKKHTADMRRAWDAAARMTADCP
jgi:hypothetical protein